MVIHTDCRHYKGSMPCSFHKKDWRTCEGCKDHDPITHKILIIKLGAVGDVLRTTSILPPLKKKYVGSEITWVTKADASSLLKGNPFVNRVLVIEGNYLEFLSHERFDIGICLDADPLSATIHALARCAERLGFITDAMGRVVPANDEAYGWWIMGVNDQRKKSNRRTYHELMYEICRLPLPIAPPHLALDNDAMRFGAGFLDKHRIDRSKKIVGVNTGGGRWQYKKWTFDGYVGFIKQMRQKYPGVTQVLLGGPEEGELNGRIIAEVGRGVVDAGCNNSLLEFASLINIVDLLLTSDSLAMHIGVALGKPTVALVGPTSPWELDLFGKGEILHSDIPCLVCYLEKCDKVVNCMNTLSPEVFLSKCEQLLIPKLEFEPALQKQLRMVG